MLSRLAGTYLIGLDRINKARYLKRELRYWKEQMEEVLASGKHGYRCEATGEGAVTCGFEPREGGGEVLVAEVDRRGFLLFRAGTIPGATVVTEDQFVPRTRYGLQLIGRNGALGIRKSYRGDYWSFVNELRALHMLGMAKANVPSVMAVDFEGPSLTVSYICGTTLADHLASHGALFPNREIGEHLRYVRPSRAEGLRIIEAARRVLHKVIDPRCVEDICAQLRIVHAAGVVWNDVKYGNIILEASSGRPFLIDFDNARHRMHLGDTLFEMLRRRDSLKLALCLNGNSVKPAGRSTATEHRCLSTVQNLFDELRREGIKYCHWKSNASLDAATAGEGDLDLLVNRADAQDFIRILGCLGFKRAITTRPKDLPGVEHYVAYDSASDEFVHVHAHYQLVCGHGNSKSYRIPIERVYIETAVDDRVCPVPRAEYELTMLVIRLVIKHCSWDSFAMRMHRLAPSEREELTYLKERCSKEQVHCVLRQHLPFIAEDVFDECLTALEPGSGLWKRMRAARRLSRSMRSCRRRSGIEDLCLKVWRRVAAGVRRRLLPGGQKLRLASGGSLIAMVGGDGAGKSTAIEGLVKWLSSHLGVVTVHLGKPRWSSLSVVVRAVLKVGRLLRLWGSDMAHLAMNGAEDIAECPGDVSLVSAVLVARDRWLVYCRARRLAANGRLVICDRYPLPGMIDMDGPRIERMMGECKTSRFARTLKRLELKYYARILPPDMLIILRVHPDTAVKRKPEESSDSVAARTRQVWEKDWSGSPALVVDAALPREEVLARLKAKIWSSL